MGDRGNIKVGKVYLYTHWGGSEIKQILQSALKRKQRWDDDSYLTRIIFCEMIKGDEDSETGYGISTSIQDNEHPIIEVDCDNQMVRQLDFELKTEWGKAGKEWTFKAFIEEKFKDDEK